MRASIVRVVENQMNPRWRAVMIAARGMIGMKEKLRIVAQTLIDN